MTRIKMSIPDPYEKQITLTQNETESEIKIQSEKIDLNDQLTMEEQLQNWIGDYQSKIIPVS